MWRDMVADINRLLPEASAELSDIRDGRGVERQSVYLSKASIPLLSAISTQFVSKSYWRSKFCSWMRAKSWGSSASLTDIGAPLLKPDVLGGPTHRFLGD